MTTPNAILLRDGGVEILDQRRLPTEVKFIMTEDYREVAEAIRTLAVRGAPAIGVAGGFGLVLAAREASCGGQDVRAAVTAAAHVLKATRPTAVNLAWAIDSLLAAGEGLTDRDLVDALTREAERILAQDVAGNHRIGELGATLVPAGARVLTHCNAGALATGGYGTALGVIRSAHSAGKISRVYADETRPLLQGARLTAWELIQDGIPVTVITDSMAGWLMSQSGVDLVIVGADRIAANGDVANKIGTYSLGVLAAAHGIPLYVAAPLSTVDLRTPTGNEIPIELRSREEIAACGGPSTLPAEADAWNPAFDVTPSRLVSAIITEAGIARAPYGTALRELFGSAAS